MLACDLIYSNAFHPPERFFRVPHPRFDHSLTVNFDGYDMQRTFYRVFTNSLGFKDYAIRDVPMKADRRRVLLIGDSFTEGVGLRFEETFAGLLHRAGNERSAKVEFLNAGVATYSPVIYHQKIKFLLEGGLHFDELVVFSDLSDVPDEATAYFCIDDDPQYRKHCGDQRARYAGPRRTAWQRNFVVTDHLFRVLGAGIRSLYSRDSGPMLERLLMSPLASWPAKADARLDPLGVEGGIKRSLQNMKKLADLLASRNIKLTIVVYPWPVQLATDERNSRQIAIWQEFCVQNCSGFINLFPAFFDEKDRHKDWLDRLFLPGDFHFSAEGNAIIFREVARELLP